ncbi:MAG: aminoacyl-tRNA hydrolase [Planctomycetota bacterium]
MRVLFGIGNPGAAYADTRHNIGFDALDRLAADRGVAFRKASSLRLEAEVEGKTVLVKPLTYVNRSGAALAEILNETKTTPLAGEVETTLPPGGVPAVDDDYREVVESVSQRLLVVVDDVNLDLGRLRLKAKGSDGGHNGLKSLNAVMGTSSYPRLRIGVGASAPGDLVEHVLGKFSPEEEEQRTAALDRAVEILSRYCEGASLTELMTTCNRTPAASDAEANGSSRSSDFE